MGLYSLLKHYGRGVVLPVDKMRKAVSKILRENNIQHVLDFGAGTLFWSDYFADTLGLGVTACDTLYTDNPPNTTGITLSDDIVTELARRKAKPVKNEAFFTCDVIHHLEPAFWHTLFDEIIASFDVIIIKDIDANAAVGNWCNKLHDRIINNEKIHDVYPQVLKSKLEENGYTVKCYALRKLWYPHFLLTACRNPPEVPPHA